MIYENADDSWLLQKEVAKIVRGKSFLDVGAGNGIQSETALNAGAKEVLAVEIDDDSLALLKKKRINAVKSNLFDSVKGKFDVIAFNPPYLPLDAREGAESRLATTGGRRGDEIILRFLRDVKSYLNDKGIILLIVSSLTPQERINNLIRKLRFRKKKLSGKRFFMERIEVWKIY